jgi:hypothetical protein
MKYTHHFVPRGSVNKSASFLEQFKIGERNFWIALSTFIFLLFFIFAVIPWWRDLYFGAASTNPLPSSPFIK